MVWIIVGFLIGIASHRGYLKFIGWHRMRRFEKSSYLTAFNIAEAQRMDIHDVAHRDYHWGCDICGSLRDENPTHS